MKSKDKNKKKDNKEAIYNLINIDFAPFTVNSYNRVSSILQRKWLDEGEKIGWKDGLKMRCKNVKLFFLEPLEQMLIQHDSGKCDGISSK